MAIVEGPEVHVVYEATQGNRVASFVSEVEVELMPYSDPDKQRAAVRAWKQRNRWTAEQREYNRKYTGNLRDAAFAAYGGYRCVCCGETTREFLTLDHVEGGGNAHRKEMKGSGSGEHLHRWLRNNGYPPGFQVLCWNCNCGRSMNGGICPHKKRS